MQLLYGYVWSIVYAEKRRRNTLNISKARMAELLKTTGYPRSAKYDPEWVLKTHRSAAEGCYRT